jgi:hypothetical protein
MKNSTTKYFCIAYMKSLHHELLNKYTNGIKISNHVEEFFCNKEFQLFTRISYMKSDAIMIVYYA